MHGFVRVHILFLRHKPLSMKTVHIYIAALCFSIAGCATVVSPDSLRRPIDRTTVTFPNGFTYDISNDTDLPRPEQGAIRGLLAGTYFPEFEDENGVYFRGVGTCVIWNSSPLKYKKRFLTEGGIWIQKNSAQPTFRLYRYQMLGTDRELPFAQSTNELNPCGSVSQPNNGTPQSATDADQEVGELAYRVTPPSATPVQAGVGAGVGVAVVQVLINSDKGKLVLLPSPPDGTKLSGTFTKP